MDELLKQLGIQVTPIDAFLITLFLTIVAMAMKAGWGAYARKA